MGGGGLPCRLRNMTCHYQEEMLTIWPDCDVQIYTPLDTVGAEWWAEYEPLQSEVCRALHFISVHVAVVGWGHRGGDTLMPRARRCSTTSRRAWTRRRRQRQR